MKVFTKSEMIDAIAKETGLSKADVARCLSSFFENISGQVAKGSKVQMTGFFTFFKKEMPARYGRNPRTGEKVKYPAKAVCKVKLGSKLREIASSKKSK